MSKFSLTDMTTAAEMKGRTALVTGATSGIGAAIAERHRSGAFAMRELNVGALAELGRERPAVVDGRGNAALAFVFGRVLSASTAARVAKRVLPMMSDR